MQGLAVILFPLLLMLFALGMEKVEGRLRRLSVQEQQVAEFLDSANTDDVASLASDGFAHAFARFRRRRKGHESDNASESEPDGMMTQRAS